MADKLVDEYLLKLDNISQHIKTQIPKYKSTADLCIASMKEKNKWSFDKVDPRESLLKQMIVHMEAEVINKSTSETKKLGFIRKKK